MTRLLNFGPAARGFEHETGIQVQTMNKTRKSLDTKLAYMIYILSLKPSLLFLLRVKFSFILPPVVVPRLHPIRCELRLQAVMRPRPAVIG